MKLSVLESCLFVQMNDPHNYRFWQLRKSPSANFKLFRFAVKVLEEVSLKKLYTDFLKQRLNLPLAHRKGSRRFPKWGRSLRIDSREQKAAFHRKKKLNLQRALSNVRILLMKI